MTPDRFARRLAVHALTPQGARLARALAREFDADVFLPARLALEGEHPFESLPALVAQAFHRYEGHLFVTACGIAVRAVAPHLRGKRKDPAVVVLDQAGRYAVSLLSGHLGGANDLAGRAAAFTGGTAVVTTATDTEGLPSLDLLARDSGLAIENIEAVKRVNGGLLSGSVVQIFDPRNRLMIPATHCGRFEWVGAPHLLEPGRPSVAVDWRKIPLPEGCLTLRPAVVAAGVGCRKGATAEAIIAAVRDALAAKQVAIASLAALATIEAKRSEPGLAQAAQELGVDLLFFSPEKLGTVCAPTSSAMALKHMGVESVCEAAAMLATGASHPLLTKMKTSTVTVALAVCE